MLVRSIISLNSRHNHTPEGAKVDSILQMLLGHRAVSIEVLPAATLPRAQTHAPKICRYSANINSKQNPVIKRKKLKAV